MLQTLQKTLQALQCDITDAAKGIARRAKGMAGRAKDLSDSSREIRRGEFDKKNNPIKRRKIMPRIDKVKIKSKAVRYNNALAEKAPDVEFKGYKQADLDRKLTAIEAKETLRAQKQAEIDLLDDELDDMYIDLDDTCVDMRSGVEGHKEFGDDSPLFGAMGHVRKSERKSGLTHKKKNSGGSAGNG